MSNTAWANSEQEYTSTNWWIINNSLKYLGLLDNVSDSIISLLDSNDQAILRNRQEEFTRLFADLENEVESISKQTKYVFHDYPRRVMASDKIVEKWYLDLFIKFPKLDEIYNHILVFADELWIEDLVRNLLYKIFFEDLVYIKLPENVDFYNYANYSSFDNWLLHNYLIDNNQTSLYECMSVAKFVAFNEVDFNKLSVSELKEFFSVSTKLKWISFCKLDFDNLSFEQLDIIFGNLEYVRYVDFIWIDFWLIHTDKIAYIFSKLSQLHYINLNESIFVNFSDEDIVKIFSSLKWLKQLYLYKMPFTQEQQELISSVLIGTKITY